MKRIYLFTLLLCAFCSGIIAQSKDFFKEKKHELRLSYGSVNDDRYYDQFYYMQGYNYTYGGGYSGGHYGNSYYYPDLSTYTGSTKTTGVIGASYFYNMSDIRFSFGGTISYSGYNTNIYNRIDDTKAGSIKGHNVAFTPTIKYAWLSKEKFRLYSGIGWSFFWDISLSKKNAKEGNGSSENNLTTFNNEFMLTPIGFSFGKKIFVFGEVNLGGRTGNFVGGAGYRF